MKCSTPPVDGWENRVVGVWMDTVWSECSEVTAAFSSRRGCQRVRQFYGLCSSRVRRNTHYQSEKWREGHSITEINWILSLGSVNVSEFSYIGHRQQTTNWQRWKHNILFFICCILTLFSLRGSEQEDVCEEMFIQGNSFLLARSSII